MSALLSHSALVGLAKETTLGTYVAPTTFVPLLGSSGFEDMITGINDESYRNNDSMLQGWYQGAAHAEWQIDTMAYPDVIGPFLRSIIGPDTITAGASTTTTGAVSAGATTIPLTSATGIATGTYINIDAGVPGSQEYALVTAIVSLNATVTTVAGSSVGLKNSHLSGATVTAQTTHTFKQTIATKPTYSITVFDTLATYGGVAASMTDCTIKIDPKAAVTFTTKWMSYLSASQSTPTATYTVLPPLLGYQWTMTNGGGASTRGLTLDWSVKRSADPIASSDGTLSPREIFVGPIDVSGTYKAIFDSNTDMNLFLSNTQSPVTALVQQRVQDGGASLAITASQGAVSKGKRDFNPIYMQADFSLNGIYNATDTGSISAVLKNFQTAAF